MLGDAEVASAQVCACFRSTWTTCLSCAIFVFGSLLAVCPLPDEIARAKHQAVLQGVDLKLARGKVLALTGASGEGKSTLASLITRLYEPRRGSITLDGLDIARLSPSWLRKQVIDEASTLRNKPRRLRCSHVIRIPRYMQTFLPASDPHAAASLPI